MPCTLQQVCTEIWAGRALTKIPRVPTLFYSARLSFGSHDADGWYLMLPELRECWSIAHLLLQRWSWTVLECLTTPALCVFKCAGGACGAWKDSSLIENKPHKSCSDSVIDSQHSDSTVSFLVPNQIIFSQNKFSCFPFFIWSHLRWSRPVGTLITGGINTPQNSTHEGTVLKTLFLSANSVQRLIDSDHIARAVQRCAVAWQSSHARAPAASSVSISARDSACLWLAVPL